MLSFNLQHGVNGLHDPDKRAGHIQWLHALPSPADVICLQECHCVSVEECSFWFPSSGLLCAVSPLALIIGVGVLCCFGRLSLLFVLGLMIMTVLFNVSSLILARFFVSHACMHQIVIRSVRSFFDDVCERVNHSVPAVLCGDFNAVFDRLSDRVESDPDDTVRKSSVALGHLFASCCVTDIWRYLHPYTSSFTWSRWNGLLASRIDLIGCPHAWISFVGGYDFLPDHYFLFLSPMQFPRVRGCGSSTLLS